MYLRIRLSSQLRKTLIERLATTYVSGQLRLYRRIQALLYIVDGKTVVEVAELLHLAEQTVRNYVQSFILQAADSLRYRRPPGRPARLTKTQRKELASLITAGPEAAGFASACWTTPLVSELILQRFDIEYHPHYLAGHCCMSWAFPTRKRVSLRIIWMPRRGPPGWRPLGRASCVRPNSKGPCSYSVTRPVSPNGVP